MIRQRKTGMQHSVNAAGENSRAFDILQVGKQTGRVGEDEPGLSTAGG